MVKNPKILALIVAAGAGSRMGMGVPKQYRPVAGKPLLCHSTEAFLAHPAIMGVAAVIAPGHKEYYEKAIAEIPSPRKEEGVLTPIIGGAERQDSVRAGLEALKPQAPDYVVIHDAARPFVSRAVIDRVVAALAINRGVVPAIPVVDTVRRLRGNDWEEIAREGLMRIQTPQGFPFKKLLELQPEDVAKFTDDAALWLAAGLPLDYVEGVDSLRKITTAEDIMWAEKAALANMRIATGFGYDVHRLIDGNSITLGGVSIPHDKKLDGHSDADVVLHALTDAILGALAEGDIGQHFPPSDPRWKGASSSIFVEEAVRRIAARGGRLLHADLTVVCEAPKIAPYRDAMQQRIAGLLKIPTTHVGIKATTTEGLGFTGAREGIAAHAVITLSLPT